MRTQNFEQTEALLLVLLLLLDEFLDELLELGLFALGDQWLFQQNLVDKTVNVSSKKFQKVSENNSKHYLVRSVSFLRIPVI